MPTIETFRQPAPLVVLDGATELAVTFEYSRTNRARLDGETTLEIRPTLKQFQIVQLDGETVLTARLRDITGADIFYATVLLDGETELEIKAQMLHYALIVLSGETDLSVGASVIEPESSTLDLIVDIVPNAVVDNYLDYGVRLTVGGHIVPIEDAETDENQNSAGKSFSATIARFSDRQYFIAGAEIVFEVQIDGVWFEEMRGVMSADNFQLSNADGKPADTFSFSMTSAANDRLLKFPTQDLTVYDPNQTEVDVSDLQPKYDTAGRAYAHNTLAVANLNLHTLFNLIYVQRCGFSAVRTNLPAYQLARIDFDPAGTFHSSVNPFTGMFNPINFTQGNDLWIVNINNALPAGFPAPATLPASRIDGFTASREYNRLDGYTLQISAASLGSFYTTDLRQTVTRNGSLRTETAATYRQYRLRSQPATVIGEVLKSQTITEYDEAVNYLFIIGRTREEFTIDNSGRFKSSVKFIEKLVPTLPGGETETLRLAKTVESVAQYKTHPFEPGKQYLAMFSRSSSGLIAIDSATPYLGKPFPQDATKALEAGNIKSDSTYQEGQIEYAYTKYRPLRNGQVDISGSTTDYVPAAVGRSPIVKPHDPQQPSGNVALDASGGNQSEIYVYPTDDYTPIGLGMEPFSVGPLPLEYAIPLARQNLNAVEFGRGEISADVLGLDMAIRRGSIRRVYDRDAEILATMVVEGIRKIFAFDKTSMILRGRQI